MRKVFIGMALVLSMSTRTNVIRAQTPAGAPVTEVPAAAPADVASPEAIVHAVYEVISGPKGAPRDWVRLRSLMAPGGIFAATGTPKGGVLRTRVITLEEYVVLASKNMSADGFYERGVIGNIWRYGDIATVRSPYESRHVLGEAPFQRGINSFQLSTDGTRWWIVSIAWEGETPTSPLPAAEDALLRAR